MSKCSVWISKTYVQAQGRKLRREYHVTIVPTGRASAWRDAGYGHTKQEANELAVRTSRATGCPLHPRWGRV